MAISAEASVAAVISAQSEVKESEVARAILEDPLAVTTGALILQSLDAPSIGLSRPVVTPARGDKRQLERQWGIHVLAAAREGRLLDCFEPHTLLRELALRRPKECPSVYGAISANEQDFDRFAVALLWYRTSSATGRAYGLPKNRAVAEAYAPLAQWRIDAERRARDRTIDNDVAAAWLSILRGIPIDADTLTESEEN